MKEFLVTIILQNCSCLDILVFKFKHDIQWKQVFDADVETVILNNHAFSYRS